MPASSALRKYHESECSFDAYAGLYAIERLYEIDAHNEDALVLAEAAEPNGIPASFTIVHFGDSSDVVMRPVNRAVRRFAGAKSFMTVRYEGHVAGVLRVEPSTSTKSDRLYFDLTAQRKGIGPNQEGVVRHMPQYIVNVIENWTDPSTVTAYLLSECRVLAGCVNENAWAPACLDVGGPGTWSEGEWLYVGNDPQINRDGTATIVHKFLTDLLPTETRKMHQSSWYFARRTVETAGGVQRQRLETIGAEQLSKVQPIAGTDTVLTFGSVFSQF